MMNLKKTIRNRKGSAMEWAIVFGLVIFALMTLLTSLMLTSHHSTKTIRDQRKRQITLNQIGEYFIRSAESNGDFPKGYIGDDKKTVQTDFSSYTWMGDEAREFFEEACKLYNFKVETLVTDTGSFWNFYANSEYATRLTVTPKNSDIAVLTIVLEESINTDTSSLILTKTTNPKTTYKVTEWTTSDDIGQMAEGQELKWYQNLWKGIGNFFGQVDDTKTAAYDCTVFYKLQKDTLVSQFRSTASLNTDDALPADKNDRIALANATCNGYKFLGWYTEPTGGTKVGDDKGIYVVTETVNLYAHWEPYKITLHCNGGNIDGREDIIPSDIPYVHLPVPTREDYLFAGWYTTQDGGTRVDTGDGYVAVLIDGVSIWAHWTPIEEIYRVTFITGEDASETKYIFDNVAYINLYSVNDAPGKKFLGWADENDNVYSGIITTDIIDEFGVNRELVLHQKWQEYVVTYNAAANGGSCSAASGSGIVTLPAPADRRSEGLSFLGWYTTQSGAENENLVGTAGDTYVPTSDITLYARWHAHMVTFNANGGSCSVTSMQGTVANLPVPTRGYYDFDGWYTAAANGTKVTGPYVPSEDITLYAHWTEWTYTLNFSNNGGTGSYPSQIVPFSNGAPTLDKEFGFTRTGYTFTGFNTKADGTGIRFAFSESFSIANLKAKGYTGTVEKGGQITLYAEWQINRHAIKITKADNATVKIQVNGGTAVTSSCEANYGDTVLITVSYSGDSNKSCTVSGGGQSFPVGTAFTMPDSDISISASSSSCVVAGTLITMADGTQKPVEDVAAGDLLLVWNLKTGSYDVAPVVFNDADPLSEYTVIHTYFSDGTDVEIVSEHGFFDVDLAKYVYIDINGAQYIGDRFVKYAADGKWEIVTLTDVVIEEKYTSVYSPVTFGHLCYYTNGMLSMPGGIYGLFNIYDVDVDTMSYDAQAMENDIELYGQLSYEDFAGIIPEEMFYAFNGNDLGIAIAKGLLTWEDIEYLAERYTPIVEDQNG